MVEEFFDNDTVKAFFSFVFGIVSTLISGQVGNKTKQLHYRVYTNKIGVTAEDNLLGSVKVTYNGADVRNLYISNMVIVLKGAEGLNFNQ